MENYKGFKMFDSGIVTLGGQYINRYDNVSSAKYAIDNDDIKISIGMKIEAILKENHDYISKLDAIRFIKSRYDCFTMFDIVRGWNYAYND